MIRTLIALCFVLIAGSAQAANRFWVGGTATWDATAGSKWATSSGGAGGAAIPGTADVAVFDSNSPGTITVASSIGGTNTIQGITLTGTGGFAGTLDFDTNDPTINMTVNFSITGTGARTINGGTAVFNMSGNSSTFDATSISGLTNPTTAFASTTLNFLAPASAGPGQVITGSGLTFGAVTVAGRTNGTVFNLNGGNTYSSLTLNGPLDAYPGISTTNTITNLSIAGSMSGLVSMHVSNFNITQATLSVTTATITGAAFRNINFDGAGSPVTATNSFDLGGNSDLNVVAPTTGAGGKIIGGGI